MDHARAAKLFEFYSQLTTEKNLLTPVSGFSAKVPFASARVVRDAWELFSQTNQRPPKLALYLHIPFCGNGKCGFCMYYSRPNPAQVEVDGYLDYLERVSDFFSPTFNDAELEALYVGGGTPSLLTVRQFDRLFKDVIGRFRFKEDSERTVENSFQTTSREKIDYLRQKGINRLSFGLQSVEEDVLRAVGRLRIADGRVRDLVGHARQQGYQELNIDLMIGLPGETEAGIARGMKLAREAGAHCVTVYIFRHIITPADGGDGVLQHYNEERIPRMLAAVRQAATDLGFVDTVQSDHTEYQFFSTPEHLDNYPLTCYRTRPDASYGNSTLGLGSTASSFIEDFFRAECRDKDSSFDPDSHTWVIETIDSCKRQRLYVIDSLYRHGFVSMKQYEHLFGVTFGESFSDEIEAIRLLGRAIIDGDTFQIDAKNRLEFASLSKFFWDQAFLFEIAGRPDVPIIYPEAGSIK